MLETRQDIWSRVWPLIVLVIIIVVMLKAAESVIPSWLWLALLVAGSVWVVHKWWPQS